MLKLLAVILIVAIAVAVFPGVRTAASWLLAFLILLMIGDFLLGQLAKLRWSIRWA